MQSENESRVETSAVSVRRFARSPLSLLSFILHPSSYLFPCAQSLPLLSDIQRLWLADPLIVHHSSLIQQILLPHPPLTPSRSMVALPPPHLWAHLIPPISLLNLLHTENQSLSQRNLSPTSLALLQSGLNLLLRLLLLPILLLLPLLLLPPLYVGKIQVLRPGTPQTTPPGLPIFTLTLLLPSRYPLMGAAKTRSSIGLILLSLPLVQAQASFLPSSLSSHTTPTMPSIPSA